MAEKTILSGMRPTGKLHLGNYVGVLANWVKLQQEYQCFFEVADWHVLTTGYEDTSGLIQDGIDVVIDWLAAGIDPHTSVVFVQSDVKEHAELHLLLSMLVTSARLERNPTVKEQVRDLGLGENVTYGHLGYPVLQTADIILYKGEVVPVGEDQAYHVELAREITRRFNRLYGDIFPEPQILLTEVPKLAGTDGRKMSKSFGNSIFLKDPPEVIRKKIQPMKTDVRRKRRTDPGEPEDCPAFTLHKAFIDKEQREEIAKGCRSAGIGCLECKNVVIDELIRILTPFWEKRKVFTHDPARVWELLEQGNTKAREVAQQTMEEVRNALGF